MKSVTLALLVPLALVLMLGAQSSPALSEAQRAESNGPRERFERARMIEESNNKLADAIVLYAQVASQSTDRQLAATAQLRIGLLQERLGRKEEAQRAFQIVVTQFAEQANAVREAEARLAAGERSAPRNTRPASRPVLSGSGTDIGAEAVSPDGRFLLGTDWSTGDLAVRDLESGTVRRVTTEGSWDSSPAHAEFSVFSADGSSIAYGWSTERGVELRIIARTGGRPRVVYHNPETLSIQPCDWSPDGRLIAAVLGRSDMTHQLALVSIADGSVRVLKTLDWRAPWKMAFSPDGRYLAYDFPPDEEAPERDVRVIAADGSRDVPIVKHPAHDVLLGWFPRGDRVLFSSNRNGTNGAWAIRVGNGAAQGEAELVKAGIGHVLAMNFTRNGEYFYNLRTGLREVQTAALDPASGTLVDALSPLKARADEGRLAAVWSPDGARIAYLVQSALVRGGEGGNILAIQTLATGQVQSLPLKVSYANRVRWMPDGRGVVVGGRDFRGRPGLFQVELATGRFEPLISRRIGRFAIAPDAATVFYEGRGTDGGAVVARDLRTGEERTIHPCDGSCGVALSPDGAWLAVKANLKTAEGRSPFPSIRILPAAGGGEPRNLVTLPDPDPTEWREMAWSADGRYLFFTKGHGELWQIAAEGGTPRMLARDLRFINSISVHPDGQRIAISTGSARYETWMMENLPTPARSTTGAARR